MKREQRLLVIVGLGVASAALLARITMSPAPAPDGPVLTVSTVKPTDGSLSLPPRQFTHEGVHYSLPFGDGSSPSMYVYQINSDNGYKSRTPHVLHNHNGSLYLEGKGYGVVTHGDQVEVTTANRVFVNGTERTPKA